MRNALYFLSVNILATGLAMGAGATSRPTAGAIIRLWTDAAPRALGTSDADIPTVTAFLAEPTKANGCAIVVCPGGGYSNLAVGHEGVDICHWLNGHGVAAFMLKYRISPYGQPVPMLDGQRAIRLVRSHAKEWGIDWKRVGIMGFSAGGHVASTVGTHWDEYIPGSPDPINLQSCRPDFMVLIYPVITMQTNFTHLPSRKILLGDNPSEKLVTLYSNELQVKDNTPPTFIVHSKTDKTVPVKNSEAFYAALQKHKIPSQFIEYDTGGHGYGMALNDPTLSNWPDKCLAWLDKQGFFKPRPVK